MNQTPAAILVLAAAVMSYAAHSASMTSHSQTATMLNLFGIGIGVWGVIALIAACIREREMLIDGHARLDALDRVMIREPLKTLKEVARPRYETRRPLEISTDAQSRLNAAARAEGRDRSEILEDMLRANLPDYDSSRVA